MHVVTPTVKELLASPERSAAALTHRWGAAALLHLPDSEQMNRALLKWGAVSTSFVAPNSRRAMERSLLMLRAFTEMQLRFLPETEPARVILGRGPESDVQFNDATVSKHHATLVSSSEGFVLHDEGSMNGTTLNSVSLIGDTLLHDGDVIGLGEFNLLFVGSKTLFLQLESVRRSAA